MPIPIAIANTIVDPKAYSLGKPADDAFAMLRRAMPLERAQPDGYEPFWVVTKHADITEIESQSALFTNGGRSSTLVMMDADRMIKDFVGEPNLVRSLISVDGPEHKALRGIGFPLFIPSKIRQLEDKIRNIARGFVDDMMARSPECDFAKDVAFLYPLRVVMQVLGVPESDEPLMLKFTQEIFGPNDPDMNRAHQVVSQTEATANVRQIMLDLEDYFSKVTVALRAKPCDGLNSVIANAKIDGKYLNHRQLMGYYIIAATAGHDTTSNTTAGALWALAERPEALNTLKANPAAISGFVEESIRWVTPVKHFMRAASADHEFRGKNIVKGDWLMLSYHSANRDESEFVDPFSFDIARTPNKQVAFGYGPHVCLGQHLARLEMRVLWEELLPRLASLELSGEPKRTQSNFVCGPKTVPIRFKPS